ncbi:unnamed protein product, partial [Symbiodinium necroappetens]
VINAGCIRTAERFIGLWVWPEHSLRLRNRKRYVEWPMQRFAGLVPSVDSFWVLTNQT